MLLVDRTVRSDRERDELLQSFKQAFFLHQRAKTGEAMIFDEISRLNNEIVNTSRELSKRNHELEVKTRKEAEAQQRFEKLFRYNPSLMAVSTVPEAAFIDVNDAFLRSLGYSKEEVLGKTTLELDLFPRNDQQAAAARQLQMTGRINDFMFQVRRKDGALLDGLFNGELIDVQGKQYFLTTMVDVTERRRAASMLQEERRRLKGVIEGTNAGTWEWNVQTGETSFNERWAQIIGHTLEELAPISIETWAALVHPEDERRSNDLLEKHFTGKTSYYDCEARMRHKDGHWVWIQDRGRVISWTDEGRPLMMFGTHSDITERKLAEKALQESEMRYRKLVDSANETIVVVQEGILRFVNPAAVALVGVPEKDLISTSFQEFIHPEDRAMVVDNYRMRSRGEPVHERYVFRLRTGDGGIKWVEISAVMIEWEGRPATLNFLTDITERKRVEEALKASESRFRDIFNSANEPVSQTP